jgi:deoxyribose-phosphate aldolase
VRALCRKAINPLDGNSKIPHVAAVCVYPNLISLVKKCLGSSGVKVASVAGSFPSGQLSLRLKVEEVKNAVMSGADGLRLLTR